MTTELIFFAVLLVAVIAGANMVNKAVSRMRDDVTQKLHEIKLELEKRR